MNSTLKKVIPLVVVLLGLGGLATWDEWKTKKDETKKKEENFFYKFDVASIEKMNYSSTGEESAAPEGEKKEAPKKGTPFNATLARTDNRWQLTGPVQADADASAVEGVLKAIAEFKYEQIISENKADWAKYGLDKPLRTIELFPKGGASVKVYLGMTAPVGYSTYVANSLGDKVYIGSQYIGSSLSKSLNDFREKAFVKLNAADLSTFSVAKNKEPKLSFKKLDNKWIVDGAKDFDTDSQVVGSLISDMSSIKAEEFLENPDAKKIQQFKKDQFVTVSWTDQKGLLSSLYFGEVDKTLYAAFDPQLRLFKVSADTKNKLSKKLEDFRNKKVFDFQGQNVQAIDADGKKFKRVGEAWYAEADAAKFGADGKFAGKKGEEPKEDNSARTLVVDIEHIKAESFLGPDDRALKKLSPAPQHKVVLQIKDQPQLEISGWQDPDLPDKVIVKNSKSKLAARVAKSIFSSLNKDAKPAADLSLPPMNGEGGQLQGL